MTRRNSSYPFYSFDTRCGNILRGKGCLKENERNEEKKYKKSTSGTSERVIVRSIERVKAKGKIRGKKRNVLRVRRNNRGSDIEEGKSWESVRKMV